LEGKRAPPLPPPETTPTTRARRGGDADADADADAKGQKLAARPGSRKSMCGFTKPPRA